LRSRIRGAGYEVKVNDNMPDTPENQQKLITLVAQEVIKDGRIPHFTKEAVSEIIEEARRRATRKHSLTLNLRELGGVIRAAGDIAMERGANYVNVSHIKDSLVLSRTLEEQVVHEIVTVKKDYSVVQSKGEMIGRVNGLAVFGGKRTGIVLPIEAEVTLSSSKDEGRVIATGKLGDIAKEAVMNVSALIKKYAGKDITNKDVHIQFLQTYEGVEGDSASISIAVAVISAMEGIPINQDVAMTGSLSIRGEVLPVGGVTSKVEAAIDAGCTKVILPYSNVEDVYISKVDGRQINMVAAQTLVDVLKIALMDCPAKNKLLKKFSNVDKLLNHKCMINNQSNKDTGKKSTLSKQSKKTKRSGKSGKPGKKTKWSGKSKKSGKNNSKRTNDN